MKNQITQKQWWAPVWKGLVMDAEAKHYRAIKSALWLYLYFLLGANRRTGVLMRKLDTIRRDMGITRDTAMRWLNVLRKNGYVETVNTGRSLTIQVTRWKAIVGVGRTPLPKSEESGSRYREYPTARKSPNDAKSPHYSGISGFTGARNETKMQINIINDPRGRVSGQLPGPGFATIGASIQQEWLAQELARKLADPAGIHLYRSYAVKFPEWLLRKVLEEVEALPPERITKGRGALFNYLVQTYAKGRTENPGG